MLDTEYIEKMMTETIKGIIDDKVKELVDRAKGELEAEIPRIVAGLSIQLMELVSFEQHERELLIRVKMDKTK